MELNCGLQSETLPELIGKPYRYTSRQWIKIFGSENSRNYKNNTDITLDIPFVFAHYNESVAQGRTTEMMGHILMYAYTYWIKYRAGDIKGVLAEEVHDNIIMLMATFYKVNMKTRSPFNSILNLFTVIKKQALYKYFGDLSNTSKRFYQKRYNLELSKSLESVDAILSTTDDIGIDVHEWGWSHGQE